MAKVGPDMRERPLSSLAQIAQATLTLFALVLALLGYIYTVKPVYTKMHAEEVTQSLRYHNRRFAIEQFTRRLLTNSAELFKTYDRFVADLQTRHSGGAVSCIDGPDGIAGDYARHKISVPNICNRDEWPANTTGRTLIVTTLSAPDTELDIVDAEQRDAIKKAVSNFAKAEAGLDAVLNFRTEAIEWPRRIEFLDLTLDEKNVVWESVYQERKRQEGNHAAFIAAVEQMKAGLFK